MNSLSADDRGHLVTMQLASLEIAKATPSSDYDVVTFKYFQDELKTVSDAATASVTALIDGAPGQLDTLKEIADSLGNNKTLSSTLVASISSVQAAVTLEASTRAADHTASDGKISLLTTRSNILQTNLEGDIQNLANEVFLRDEQYQSVTRDIANQRLVSTKTASSLAVSMMSNSPWVRR